MVKRIFLPCLKRHCLIDRIQLLQDCVVYDMPTVDSDWTLRSFGSKIIMTFNVLTSLAPHFTFCVIGCHYLSVGLLLESIDYRSPWLFRMIITSFPWPTPFG